MVHIYQLYVPNIADSDEVLQKIQTSLKHCTTLAIRYKKIIKNANGSISEYLPESRNFLKTNRHNYEKRRYLHKSKDNITNFLDKLPKTKHDHSSFVVDVPLANAAMVQIVLNGVFAEEFEETNDRHVF
ncbi:nuclear RNA export factor 2-like [Aphis craccivora]|uniref:Nuclear RNA export factor 2-like n=1 Tax=Aphis craccivora TaxID=307492 RepID=A0A6G0ZBL8_APHCR|nr:nuclear RNA export factor 2-like [Aphis craccivora]